MDNTHVNFPKSTTIRVVNTKRPLVDISLISHEELHIILEDLALKFDPNMRQALFGLEHIASNIHALRDRGPANLNQSPINNFSDTEMIMNEVALRQLLNSDAIRPVITAASLRAGGINDDKKKQSNNTNTGLIRVRPSIRKVVYALHHNTYREAAVAAEQPIEVEGLVIIPKLQGSLILDILAGDVFSDTDSGLYNLINSGTYVAAVLSVVLARNNPLIGPYLSPVENSSLDNNNSIVVWPYTPDLVLNLRRQFSAALNFHLSGTGALLALGAANKKIYKTKKKARHINLISAIVSNSRGVTLPTYDLIKYFISHIAEVFTEVTNIPDEFIFALTPLVDIYRVGAFTAYYYILAEGRDAIGPRRFLDRAAIAHAERNQIATLKHKDFIETAQARHYMIIIEDKFGTTRVNDIINALAFKGSTAVDNPKLILSKLQKREREIITTEYDNRCLEWKAHINNKCPHIELSLKLRSTKSSLESLNILTQLEEYFKPVVTQSKLEWIYCKNCGFRIICPHVKNLIQMRSRNLPYDTIRTALMKYAIQYTNCSKFVDTYSYFCRICSEQLAEFTSEDRTADIFGAIGDLNDYIRKTIWVEAISATEYVRFPMPIDSRKFAGTAIL